jgi:hypothetical protein
MTTLPHGHRHSQASSNAVSFATLSLCFIKTFTKSYT